MEREGWARKEGREAKQGSEGGCGAEQAGRPNGDGSNIVARMTIFGRRLKADEFSLDQLEHVLPQLEAIAEEHSFPYDNPTGRQALQLIDDVRDKIDRMRGGGSMKDKRMTREDRIIGGYLDIFQDNWRAANREGLTFDIDDMELWEAWLIKIVNADFATRLPLATRLADEITDTLTALRLERIARGAGGRRARVT